MHKSPSFPSKEFQIHVPASITLRDDRSSSTESPLPFSNPLKNSRLHRVSSNLATNPNQTNIPNIHTQQVSFLPQKYRISDSCRSLQINNCPIQSSPFSKKPQKLTNRYLFPFHRPRISIIGTRVSTPPSKLRGGSTRGNSRGREGEDRQAGVVLERSRTGPFPPSFSHCFCARREARGRIINSSPHSGEEEGGGEGEGEGALGSPVQIRGTMTIIRNRADRARNLANDNLGRLHYLFPSPSPPSFPLHPTPLSITRPAAIVTRHPQ